MGTFAVLGVGELVQFDDEVVETKRGLKKSKELIEGDYILVDPIKNRHDDTEGAVFTRLFGYIIGDGHVSKKPNNVSIYTSQVEDVEVLVKAVETVTGKTPGVNVRQRKPHHLPACTITIRDKDFYEKNIALGQPIGKKIWELEKLNWLYDADKEIQIAFLDGLFCAELTTPYMTKDGNIGQHAIKQNGGVALPFVQGLLWKFGFESSITPSGPISVLTVLGEELERRRFLETFPFTYHKKKSEMAAKCLSISEQRFIHVLNRINAYSEAKKKRELGISYKVVVPTLSKKYNVSESLIYHGYYGDRGIPRNSKGTRFDPEISGYKYWSKVRLVRSLDKQQLPMVE